MIGDSDTANVAVTPVAIRRSVLRQERVTVTAGVTNHGAKALDGVDVTLEVNSRPLQTQRVKVDANASSSTTFAPVTLTPAEVRATVRVGDDAMNRDNAFHFMVAAGRPVRTLLAGRPGTRDPGLYIGRWRSEKPRASI